MPYTDPTFEQRRAQLLKGSPSATPVSSGSFSGGSSGGFLDQSFEQRRKQILSTPSQPIKPISTPTPTPAPATPNFLQQTQQNVTKFGSSVLSGLGEFAQQAEKKIQGIFKFAGGSQFDIISPVPKTNIPELTPQQIKAISTTKIGEKLPGFELDEPKTSGASAQLTPEAKKRASEMTFGNLIDNVMNKPIEYGLNHTGPIGEGIKNFASELYNNPIETIGPASNILKTIKKQNPELYKKFEDNPVYKFEEAGIQGIMQGALRVYANWNPKVQTFLDTEVQKIGTKGDAEIAGNTVGNIIGTIGSFVLGGEVVSALKFGKVALPATFAVLGQTSLPSNTPADARLRNLIVDTVSGTLLEYIKPLANVQKMGLFQKGAEYTKQLAKSMTVLSGQTYLDARSVGASDEQAKEMVKDSMLILLGLHGFMIAGKAGNYAISSKFREGSAVFTPDQARAVVVGSNLENTKLGNAIMKASMEAESLGKNIQIDMTAAKKSKIAGALNLQTPNGIAITKIEYVEANQQPKLGSAEKTPEGGKAPTVKPEVPPETPPTKTGEVVPTEAEIKRVSSNLIKNNPGLSQTEAEAMAKDVIINRQYNQPPTQQPASDLTSQIRVPATFNNPIEEKAFNKITSDPQKAVDEYIKAFENEVSPDLALTQFEGYEGHNAGELSRASGAMKSLVYNDLLNTQQGIKNNTVLITAGGSGSGKTTGVQKGEPLKDEYSIVVDTTFSNNSAPKDIQKALDKGFKVDVAFTFRDPATAWTDGALKRVGEEGRVVSEGYFLQSHIDAQKNIIRAYNKYKDNPNVSFTFIQNTPDRTFPEVSFDKVSKHLYNRGTLAQEIIDATDNAYEQDKITESQYKALTADREKLGIKAQEKSSIGTEGKVSGESGVSTDAVRQAIRVSESGYEPSHPWFYKEGTKPLTPLEIKLEAQNDVALLPAEKVKSDLEFYTPKGKINDKVLSELAKIKRADLKETTARYEEVVNGGIDALTDPNPDEMTLNTALSLTHNHVLHNEYVLALIDRYSNPENYMSKHPPVEPSVQAEMPESSGGGVQKLTIAPTLADTPEKVIEEAQKLGLPPTVIKNTFNRGSGGTHVSGYVRPKIGKAEFKILVQNSQELKDNPVLVVDEQKNLVFNGERVHFTIKPEALQIKTDNLNPGDEVTIDTQALKGTTQQMRISDKQGNVLGYNPKTESAPEGEVRIPDIGAKFNTDQVFIERLGKDPFVLARHSGGSMRDVYDLGDAVAKVANSPKGLQQNDSEGDYGVEGLIPEVLEKGKDYVIVQKAQKDLVASKKFLKPLQSFTAQDFDNKTSDLQDTMETMGLSDFLNYDLLWNDFIAPRNWGFIDGKPVLTDAGALDRRITFSSEPDEYAVRDWRQILQERKNAKQKIASTGKYPKEIYDAYNSVYGTKLTASEIDRQPLGEIRQTASQGLSDGTKEFDEILNPPTEKGGGNLGFNPKNLEDPFSEVATKEVDKIVKQSDIAKRLAEKLNVPIRRGKFRHGSAIGIFKPGPKVVRIKSGGLNTIFHEVAHFLDDTIGFSKEIPISERKNLMQEYGYSYDGQPAKQMKEAFAEYMRFRMTGQQEKINEWSPEFDKIFNEKIKTMPEVDEVINTATEDFKRWNEQPATSKILSHISIGGEAKNSFKDRAIQTMHDLYTSGLDDLHPLEEFAKLGRKNIGEIDAVNDPYILARNLRGWVGKADMFLNQGTFKKEFWTTDAKGKIKMNFTGKSYSEIMKPVEKMKALDDFRVYIVAQRVVYDLAPRKIKSGISLADAKKALEELNKKYPDFERIASERRAFNDRLLEYAKDNGVIGDEGLKKIKELNHYHVPFYRVMEESGGKFLGKSKVGGNIGNPIKKIKGSEREIIDPLESDVKNVYAIINASERNNIGIAMANIASQNFELGRLFEEVARPMKPITVNVGEVMKQAVKGTDAEDLEIPEELADAVVTLFRTTYATGPNMLNVNMGDKQKVFEVDSDLFKAIQGLNIEDIGIIMKILSAPAKILRAGATLSPDFSVRNPLRDQFTAFAYSKNGFIPGIDLVRGMFELFRKGDTYNLWKAGGGEHAMFVSLDRQELQKNLKDVLSDPNLKDTVVDVVKNPLKVLQIISEFGEAGTRLGEMRNALARGVNPVQGAYDARNVTLDFSRIGAKTRGFNAIVAFFNANIQGTDAMIRNFKDRPFQTLWKVLIGLTLPSILLYLANRKDPRWKEIPQWQKNLFWIVMTPKHIWRIPKPFELGVLFGSVPERILEVIDTKDPEKLNELENSIASGFTPGFLPTALIPVIENITNYSFFLDRPIVNRGKENLPPEQQFGPYTTEVSKLLGEALHYSPAKIDNLVAGYGGGIGKYASEGLDKILLGTGIVVEPPKPAKKFEELPVIKAFLIREPIGTGSESVNQVYNKYATTNAELTYVKQLVKDNKTDEALEYVKKHPDSIDAITLTAVVDTFSTMNKAVDLIRQSDKMTPQEKTDRIDQIGRLQTELAQKALAEIKSRKKK